MSKADEIFIRNVREILNEGYSDQNLDVRPRWKDGTPAHTINKFGIVNRYDLRDEFPIITLRRTFFKTCIDEMLWIWQKKSNNIRDLNSGVWDSWADETGSIGKAYGYQLALKHSYPEGARSSTLLLGRMRATAPIRPVSSSVAKRTFSISCCGSGRPSKCRP